MVRAGADHITRNASNTHREVEIKDHTLHSALLKCCIAHLSSLLRGRERAGATAQLRPCGGLEKILDPIAPILIFKTAQFR
jgi:hypothetical protein